MTSPDPTAGTAEKRADELAVGDVLALDDGDIEVVAVNRAGDPTSMVYAHPSDRGVPLRFAADDRVRVRTSDPTAVPRCPECGDGELVPGEAVTAETVERAQAAWLSARQARDGKPTRMRAALAAVLPDLLSAAREAGLNEGRGDLEWHERRVRRECAQQLRDWADVIERQNVYDDPVKVSVAVQLRSVAETWSPAGGA